MRRKNHLKMNSQPLPVLLYHRVVNGKSPIGRHKTYVSERNFRNQMQWLKRNNYQTITFRDLEKSDGESRNPKKVILTFDDGYADNYSILFPILKEFGFKAVIFLVTGYTRNEWSIREGEPALDLMTREQIREMDAYGIEFGGHTQHHVDLKLASEDTNRKEILGCFSDLESLLGKKPLTFSYPFGAYNEYSMRMMPDSGFKFAVTTIFGAQDWKQNRFCINRNEVRPKTTMFSFKHKVSGRYF